MMTGFENFGYTKVAAERTPKETPRWNDKRKYHGGVRQTHYNIMLTAPVGHS